MFRLWVIALLAPSLAFARVVPSSHINQLKGERVKDAVFDDSKDFSEVKQSEDFIDSYDFSESDESPAQSSNDPSESGESESTTSMPIFLQEDQEMRFRYALSQILLPPPSESEDQSFLKLPPAVEKERDSMIRQGEDFFRPRNLEELEEFRNLEELEELLDELPELAAGEKYGGPNTLNVEDGDDYEDVFESAGELDDDEYLDEDGIGQEQEGGDEGEWIQEEDEDVEDDDDMDGVEDEVEEKGLEENENEEEYGLERDEDQRLPELSVGEKFESPSDIMEVEDGEEQEEEEDEDGLAELSSGEKYEGPRVVVEEQVVPK